MDARLGVLLIHGQGNPKPNYADGLVGRLRRRLGQEQAQVAFEACYWAPILQKHQDVIWQRTQSSGKLDWMWAREWVVSYLGDPAAYLSGFFRSGKPVYGEIHECVRASLERLEGRVDGGTTGRLMIVTPSLGSVITTNYFWDETEGKREDQGIGKTPFQRMETLVSLVTYGSSIPLFVPPSSEIVCIRFPSPTLNEELRSVARWHNLYDADDVLGYPLRKLWDRTQDTEIDDVQVNAGLWPFSETPLAHNFYESTGDFLRLVVERMRAILAVPGSSAT